ncbi:MAG: hypothetical protein K8S25_01405, partial [Alphaproteobacteria bacterium]|nr:hypothetical protein [Alphaproteobacteria bacterium]
MSQYQPVFSWVLALLLFTAASGAAPGGEPPPPAGWVVYPTPKSDACEWKRAYYSKREWLVRSDGERLVIEPIVDGVRSKTRKTPVPGLVGFNFGEYGGRLWWTDSKGHNAYHIADPGKNCDGRPTPPGTRFYENTITNIVSLQRTGERALAISGHNHLGWSLGEISREERRDGKWQTCRLRDLGSVPYAVIADGPQWLVLAE